MPLVMDDSKSKDEYALFAWSSVAYNFTMCLKQGVSVS